VFGIDASLKFLVTFWDASDTEEVASSLGSMQEANRQLNRGLVDVGAIGS